MDLTAADQIIRGGQKLVYVQQSSGPSFLAKFQYDPSFSEACSVIPSFKSVYAPDPTGYKPKGIFQGWKVHYLDLPILEALSYKHGYVVNYADRDPLRRLKGEYLDRREWKTKPVVEVPLIRKLDEKQTIGAQFMYKAKRALNADGMGGGKTAQGIGAVELNRMDGRPCRTLVIGPKTLKGMWAKERKIVTGRDSIILDGKMEKRFEQYEEMEASDFAISSFDSFVSDFKEIAQAFKPDIVIVDECHRLCTRENKLTQIFIGGRDIKKTFFEYVQPHSIYLLTGTPISNELEDLYPLLKLLDPEIMHWMGFRNRYAQVEEGERWVRPTAAQIAAALARGEAKPKAFKRGYAQIVGYQNEAELKGKLSLHMIRRTKDELLPNLPPKSFHTVEVELDAEERQVYNQLRDEFTSKIRGKDLTVKSQLEWMTRAQQIVDSLEIVPNSTAKKSSKLAKMLEIVTENVDKRKIVIFSKYKEMTDIIVRELKDMRIKHLYLHGDVKDEDRQPLVDKFQENDDVRVFVSTLKAGGVGITLTKASLCILYDRWWSPGANFQAVDRLHRRGQENPVDAVFLRVKDSVEEYVERKWLEKQAIVNDMIDDEAVLAKLTTEERGRLI